ncbi:unnamed protein product [Adineta steineri]|uniref:Uncharacterized protein n=1 Tax=Adineta steineri TaxID=433720 RepID=A0A814HR92_9BILA|nr:unnamed protein product [Adineta steineri]
MNHPTKMIIITSNKDLIDELSTKKSADTQIINCNGNNLIDLISKDNNNSFDFNFLAQLSELNSNNDQIYKHVLDTSQDNRSKIGKTSKKTTNLVCVICSDHAIGFNYDVLTCASCKAFFRRNAHHHPDKLRCLTGEKKCSIDYSSFRKCQRCRLVKCFMLGMRRDFIITDEVKRKRRQRIEENRQLSYEYQSTNETINSTNDEHLSQTIQEIDQLLMDTDNDNIISHDTNEGNIMERISSKSLSIEDRSEIGSIELNYSSIFHTDNITSFPFNMSDRTSALISWSEFTNRNVLKLIEFFQHIDEFENLNLDDKFILIKYNLLSLHLIQKCLNYNVLTGSFTNMNDEDRLKRREFFNLCYGTSGIRESFKSLMNSFSIITEQDSTLIKLILIILIFTKGLSMNENEPFLKDTQAVNRAQSYYIRLTWNYLIDKQGEQKTIQQFMKLLSEITRIQLLNINYRQFFRSQLQSTDALERFSPLMKSVLNIV